MLRRVLLLVLLAALVAPAAVASPRAATTTTVGVRMTEFKFMLTKSAVPRVVVFKLVNKGTVPHDFKIKGKRSAKIQPGRKGTLRVTFTKPGKYRYVCTLPGHAAAGMKGVLRVR